MARPLLILIVMVLAACGVDEGPSVQGVDLTPNAPDAHADAPSLTDSIPGDEGADSPGIDGLDAIGTECESDDDCIGRIRGLGPCEKAYCVSQTKTCKKGPAPDGQTCEDGNPCTNAGTCKNQECIGSQNICNCESDKDCKDHEDGNPCTGTLYCDESSFPFNCEVDPKTVVQCPDSADPCTVLTCQPETGTCSEEPANEGGGCDDGLPCSLEDQCVNGVCQGTGEYDCDDDNACTDDWCDPDSGDCLHEMVVCDDGDACNGFEYCEAPLGCQSDSPPDCDDGLGCTLDGCDPGFGCYHTALVCDDVDACTSDWCDPGTGKCTYEQKVCNNGNVCDGEETCDPETGCVDGIPLNCSDFNECTDDSCHPSDGCKHFAVLCADDNPCTADSCDTGTGQCVFQLLDCDDGNPCNGKEVCLPDAGCTPGDPLDCKDGNACTVDSCDPASGCNHTPEYCDDGDPCTADTCNPVLGCVHGVKNCNDGDACTDDFCDPLSGGQCAHVPKDCSDGNPCTFDACDPQTGCSHGLVSCNDWNPCTVDTCEKIFGQCVFTPVVCDDGNFCTMDSCDADTGDCVNIPLDCTDGNPCTLDTCDPATGACQSVLLPCDDGNACTMDSCNPISGLCTHIAVACNDGNACTVDACDPTDGNCLFIPIEVDDGDACNGIETCDPDAGIVPGIPLDCDDQNPCSLDDCNPLTGCVSEPIVCYDDNLCTEDSCDPDAGGCVHLGKDCDDGKPCTADACDPATGDCTNWLDCQDGNACTYDWCDPQLSYQCRHSVQSCDDDDPCTDDSCDPDTGCVHSGNGACCYDGKVDPGEECDDGNFTDWDGCNDCQIVEFLANSHTTGHQVRPGSASRSDGSFIVAWDNESETDSLFDVFARLFAADGLASVEEFPVSESDTSDHGLARVAAFVDHRFVVTWRSIDDTGLTSSLRARTYTASGVPESGSMKASTSDCSTDMEHAVGTFPGGGFLTAWDRCNVPSGSSDPGFNICGRFFDGNGNPEGSEFTVASSSTCCPQRPSIATWPNGDSLVVWTEFVDDPLGWGLYARRYPAAGTDDPIQLALSSVYAFDNSSVSALSQGGFVVAWERRYGFPLEDTNDVLVQQFDADGVPVTTAKEVVHGEPFHEGWARPRVATFEDDGFVVTWHGDDSSETGHGVVRARIAGSDGAFAGDSFKVNSYTPGNQNLPMVSTYPPSDSFASGGFMVTWHSNLQDGSGFGVYVQRYHADGEKKYR